MIRELTPPCALDHLADLHAACFDDAWSAEWIATLMAQPGVIALSADEDGFIITRIVSDEAEVLTLAVAPATRRRGIGSALVTAAIRHAAEMGARRMFLEVGSKNFAAKSLYIRLGFKEVGRRSGYYAATRGCLEDALVMSVEIPLLRV